MFWLCNLIELVGNLKVGKDGDERPRLRKEKLFVDCDQLELGMTKAISDLEKFIQDFYQLWLKEEKRQLKKISISAIIEHQGLPGFTVESSSGFFGVFGYSQSTITIEDFIVQIDDLYCKLNLVFADANFVKQVMNSMLRFVSVTCFNQLLSRKHFATWKRGMQIQYNLTRIEEWCSKNKLIEGPLNFERLAQTAKLLQLSKTGIDDIETIFDVCFLLSPSQIKKVISLYYLAEFETPISPQLIKAVANRAVGESDDNIQDFQEIVPLFLTPKSGLKISKFVPKDKTLPMYQNLIEILSKDK